MTDNLIKKNRPQFIDDIYRSDSKVGRFLSVLILFGVAFGLKRGIQDNYLAEIINIEPFERGIVEFFRELPGLLLIFILALMYRFADSKVFKVGIALMTGGLVGLFIVSMTNSTTSSEVFLIKILVIFFMVIFSTGEHVIMPVRSTIAMELAKREKAGASLGITTSINQLGNIAGFLLVTVIFLFVKKAGFSRTDDILGYRIVFGIALGLMVAAALVAAALKETTLKAPRQRFYFAKKFSKYYILEVFYGSRKQIFLTFAPYVLILQYGADPSLMSILFAVCAVFVMLCSPLIGKLIDKVGYKAVMVGDTIILIVVCLMYGFAHRMFAPNIAFIIVCINFILDQIISIASMANNVYVQRISKNRAEITATLSTGISVNHIFSVLIALLGGWVWKVAGIETLFTISAFLALINSIYAVTIKKEEEQQGGTDEE
ncbi:MAG: MFS transporter [Treponema sp.]|nr:MFS transporter [Treponema sp.]MCL2251857.1 MFS transporter [Treponema sp.]